MSEEEMELIDGFFNKGWCCDLDEVYKIYMKAVDLYNKEKEKNEELEEIYNRAMKEYNTAKGFNEVLENKLKKQKDDIRSLHIENQALFESINCNDDNMLAREYQKLKEKNKDLKNQVDVLLEDIDLSEDDMISMNRTYFNINYISKDKIRNKIKELKDLSNNITMQPQIY